MTMIHRVAQRLRAECQEVFGTTWDNDVARRFARVAIEAMREPTTAQYYALSATGKMWHELNSELVWKIYIDAALDERDSELQALVRNAVAAYKSMSPGQKAEHDYAQKRSFVRGMCPDDYDFGNWCALVDRIMPPRQPTGEPK